MRESTIGVGVGCASRVGFVFTSGLISPSAAATMADTTLEAVDSDTQIRECLETLAAEVEAAGSGTDRVINVEAFLTSIEQVGTWNAEFTRIWPTPGPARTSTIVGMVHPAVLFEVRAVAVI